MGRSSRFIPKGQRSGGGNPGPPQPQNLSHSKEWEKAHYERLLKNEKKQVLTLDQYREKHVGHMEEAFGKDYEGENEIYRKRLDKNRKLRLKRMKEIREFRIQQESASSLSSGLSHSESKVEPNFPTLEREHRKKKRRHRKSSKKKKRKKSKKKKRAKRIESDSEVSESEPKSKRKKRRRRHVETESESVISESPKPEFNSRRRVSNHSFYSKESSKDGRSHKRWRHARHSNTTRSRRDSLEHYRSRSSECSPTGRGRQFPSNLSSDRTRIKGQKT